MRSALRHPLALLAVRQVRLCVPADLVRCLHRERGRIRRSRSAEPSLSTPTATARRISHNHYVDIGNTPKPPEGGCDSTHTHHNARARLLGNFTVILEYTVLTHGQDWAPAPSVGYHTDTPPYYRPQKVL